MTNKNSIITVGISPAWDLTCKVHGLEWGEHKKILSQQVVPAGKSLNVSRALAWTGTASIACGLWGEGDYLQMLNATADLSNQVEINFTKAPGCTRQNLTIIDKKFETETHLRAESQLASRDSLKNLKDELELIADDKSIFVFSGAMPDGETLKECLKIIESIKKTGAAVVVDTSGLALQEIVASGGIKLIKPNLAELNELLSEEISDEPAAIIKSARALCDRVEMVLISRGEKGAVLVSKDNAFIAAIKNNHNKAENTVGCGDYLLAGFLSAWSGSGDPCRSLTKAIKVASARAWGWCESQRFQDAQSRMEVDCCEV